jgi:hypothetical protein
MQIEQVKEAITETPKGANIIIEWSRDGKTRKGTVEQITKQVRMVGRIGIQYDKQKVVQEKRENGELPTENQGLPWGEFEVYPYLIAHKDKKYVRLYKGTSDKVKPKVAWFKDGEQVERSEIDHLLLASEKSSSKGDCFVVNAEDVTRLNSEAVTEAVAEAVRVEVAVGVAEPV